MSIATRVRRMVVDSPNSLGARARRNRWAALMANFPELPDMKIVDLGGTVDSWLRAPVRPAHVRVLNLHEPGTSDEDWLVPVVGDACDPFASIGDGGGESFDLVFSNAVMEHVGGHSSCSRFANSVHSLAPRHWIQTPYRYFPLEPHWLFPGMQFLPVVMRARIAGRWPFGHTKPSSAQDALSSVMWTELLSLTEMRLYFPDSQILLERACGLVKSLIAVRT